MKIHDDHLYHGAALTQIAEHKQFTSINALEIKGKHFNNVYVINNHLIHLKYASKPRGSLKEYQFTFSSEHLEMLDKANEHGNNFILCLVCVYDREICALPYKELVKLLALRRNATGRNEEQYVVLLSLPKDSAFRVSVAAPGKRRVALGKELKIARNKFPNCLFN